MYDFEKDIYLRIERMISESESCLNLLYVTPCLFTRNMLLYQLRTKLDEIGFLSSIICSKTNQIAGSTVELPQQVQPVLRDFTLQELAKYNGKDGNAAYVAVNGIVYDVTNNAAWAAASHFGLMAGKDLTSEFSSCHAGQLILSKLKIVGKLITTR
jgi:membrane-associated progesterone receptor component